MKYEYVETKEFCTNYSKNSYGVFENVNFKMIGLNYRYCRRFAVCCLMKSGVGLLRK